MYNILIKRLVGRKKDKIKEIELMRLLKNL